MCGILVLGWNAASTQGPTAQTRHFSTVEFADCLAARGPDQQGETKVHAGSGAKLQMCGSLLQLRGRQASHTPLKDSAGNVLLFNGEIFGGLEVGDRANDAHTLLHAFANSTSLPSLLSSLRGPWALAYWQEAAQTLWFGRDIFGKRSMLMHFPDTACPQFILTSVACLMPVGYQPTTQPVKAAHVPAAAPELPSQLPAGFWQELPPGVHSISMASRPTASSSMLPVGQAWLGGAPTRHEWRDQLLVQLQGFERPAAHLGQAETGAAPPDAVSAEEGGAAALLAPATAGGGFEAAAQQALDALQQAVNIRCRAIDRIADAGGRAHSINSLTAGTVLERCVMRQPVHKQAGMARLTEPSHGTSRGPAQPAQVAPATAAGDQQPPQGPQVPPSAACCPLQPTAPVLVLFSGGVDSTLLAACAHRALPAGAPIDLASVCFDDGCSPDRLAALDAVQELSVFAPERQWRLIEVDASLGDVDTHREHLLRLLHPADTVMDLNIAAAVWLAARAEGHVKTFIGGQQQQQPESQLVAAMDSKTHHEAAGAVVLPCSLPRVDWPQAPQHCHQGCAGSHALDSTAAVQASGHSVTSAARVALLGHGADELHAGYGRHRSRFRTEGYTGLQQELVLDMQRLWRRNLGRDDRIIADTRREARHPFLDEAYVSTILGFPLPLVADLSQPPGSGDKLLLRAALRQLGLPRAAARVKRAIQFGTRIGKLANVRDFGSNRAANIKNAGSVALPDVAALRLQCQRPWEASAEIGSACSPHRPMNL